MEQYTKPKLFERRQEDLDAAIKGSIPAIINYYSVKQLEENMFEINQSITISN